MLCGECERESDCVKTLRRVGSSLDRRASVTRAIVTLVTERSCNVRGDVTLRERSGFTQVSVIVPFIVQFIPLSLCGHMHSFIHELCVE